MILPVPDERRVVKGCFWGGMKETADEFQGLPGNDMLAGTANRYFRYGGRGTNPRFYPGGKKKTHSLRNGF